MRPQHRRARLLWSCQVTCTPTIVQYTELRFCGVTAQICRCCVGAKANCVITVSEFI